MSDFAIRTHELGKSYQLGAREARYSTMRDRVTEFARGAAAAAASPRRTWRARRPQPETIWALKDVSFEVAPGSVVGLIGRNGAGKSTLLKLLSRITDPSEGWADIRGRLGSLLEVGTGFHPELTGRENIYLSGAILGMKRAEISRKFDDIVSFAEVDRFVDTAVKHYSSGMYLRLAFAVAAHLEPEILLVDEVLAVGDARFQRKCIDKMQDVGKQGSTVLFVSHNMPAVTRLCERAIMLDNGRVAGDGPAHEIVAAYLHSGLGTMAAREWLDPALAPGTDVVRLRAIRIRTEEGLLADTVDIRQAVGVELEYEVLQPGHVFLPHFSVHNAEGAFAFVAFDQDPAWRRQPRPAGRYVSTGWIPGNLLSEGIMLVGPSIRTLGPDVWHFWEKNAAAFQVVDAPSGDTARGDFPGGIPGVVRPLLKWDTRIISEGTHERLEREGIHVQA